MKIPDLKARTEVQTRISFSCGHEFHDLHGLDSAGNGGLNFFANG